MKQIPVRLGEVAVHMGTITEEQLNEVLEVQCFYDPPKLLGEILVEKGYITRTQLQQLLNVQKQQRKQREDECFAAALAKLNILSSAKITEGQTYQKAELQKGRQLTLPVALVELGLLSIEKAKQVMKSPSYRSFLEEGSDKSDNALEVLKGYKLIEKISAGGMGIVYKALQIELDRVVALKVLSEEFSKNEEYIKRFYYEAKLAAKPNHPNLVQIYDVGHDKGKYFYSMELVEGENMAVRLRTEGRFQPDVAVDLITQVAKALAHLHELDIVHGDIKPDNVIIRNDGIAKLMDLGLAKQMTQQDESKEIIGTPYYMSPEQISGKKTDERSDIFSLGASFYRMLTGKYAFSGQTTRAIIQAVLKKKPVPITEIDYTIPEDLSRIVNRMLRKDPERRYQRVKDVLHALDKILL